VHKEDWTQNYDPAGRTSYTVHHSLYHVVVSNL